MRVGIYSYNFDVNELVRVTNEPNEILEAVRGYVGNIIGVGLYYSDIRDKVEHFFSYSVPNVVSLRRFKAENGITTEVTDRIHHYFVGGSVIKMGENNLIPHFLVRQVKHAPLLYSFLIGFDFRKNFEFGFGITNNDYLSGYFSLKKIVSDWQLFQRFLVYVHPHWKKVLQVLQQFLFLLEQLYLFHG